MTRCDKCNENMEVIKTKSLSPRLEDYGTGYDGDEAGTHWINYSEVTSQCPVCKEKETHEEEGDETYVDPRHSR